MLPRYCLFALLMFRESCRVYTYSVALSSDQAQPNWIGLATGGYKKLAQMPITLIPLQIDRDSSERMPHASSFKGRNHFPLSKFKIMLQPIPSRRALSEKMILQKSEKEQHFSGSVRIVGPVQVVESFRSDRINGKHKIVKGFFDFTGP